MVSALFDSLMASGGEGGTIPPKISETPVPMTMKFVPYFKINIEARNQKK